jgi:hypothetical protein
VIRLLTVLQAQAERSRRRPNHVGCSSAVPTGPVVEEFSTEEEAQAAVQRHQANGVSAAVKSPAPPGSVVPSQCSFCGKGQRDVGHLIAGPSGIGRGTKNEEESDRADRAGQRILSRDHAKGLLVRIRLRTSPMRFSGMPRSGRACIRQIRS